METGQIVCSTQLTLAAAVRVLCKNDIFKAAVRSTEGFHYVADSVCLMSVCLSAVCLLSVCCPGTFQAMWLVDAVHEGYQLVFSLVRILHLLRPGWRQNSCVQCTSVLVYTTSVKPYNWFRQTVCNPSLNENNVAGSIWHGSKNCRKGRTIIFWFQDNFLSWNCLIGATLIALGSGGTSNFRQAGAG